MPKSFEALNRSPITLNIGDDLTALTKTNVTIQCPTSGVPRPTVTWTKDGRILRDDGRYTVQTDGALVIDEANEEDSARYTCNADSVNGQDSASSKVQIVGELHLPKIHKSLILTRSSSTPVVTIRLGWTNRRTFVGHFATLT